MKKTFWIYTGIICLCFLYTGSAFMSQSFRLMDFYSEKTVDIITSVFNYLFQGLGILIFSIGLNKRPDIFIQRRLFITLLITGSIFMCLSQLSNSGLVVQTAGYIFNLHIGVYFGYYLAMLGKNVPPKLSGLSFGTAYAIASVGTYILSLIHGGNFLISKEITAIYLILASLTIALVYAADDLGSSRDSMDSTEYISLSSAYRNKDLQLLSLMGITALITVIFTVGSGLYYSLPVAASVNWNLIRAFYALGLVLAGFIMDRKRFVGEILTIASLTYPLIMLTLIGDGLTNNVALGISYVVRGFITIYYVTTFTDLTWEKKENLPLAPLGLMISRFVEALMVIPLMVFSDAEIAQLVLAAACFVPLLILFVNYQSKRYAPEPISDAKRLALYSEKYNLTSRETEILKSLAEGMTDSEISEKYFISKNTVRFHVSNLLKKTGTTSRVEVVQSLNKF